VRKQDHATAAEASIEDVAEHSARADALVRAVLGLVMRQRRSTGTALDYVRALSPGTRANCWELAEAAGHEGPGRMQALLRSYKWPWEKLRRALPGLAAQCLPDDPDDLIGPGIAFDETAHLKPKLLGGGMSPTALTWAFASSVAKSSGYIADQRKRDHGIWSWSRIFCTEKPCPGQCSRRSG